VPTSSLRAAFAVALCLCTGLREAPGNPAPLADVPATVQVAALADGDLVFRRGHDMVTRLVLTQGEAPRFSHVGIIVLEHGRADVVHAMPSEDGHAGGVVREPLATFASSANATDAAVYRVSHLDSRARARLQAYALAHLGTPFDNAFRLSDSTSVYCTEFALRAVAAAGVTWIADVPRVHVVVLPEPVIPPDYLRRMPALTPVEGALRGDWEVESATQLKQPQWR